MGTGKIRSQKGQWGQVRLDMFEKEDKTFNNLLENSVNDWLSQISKHDDLAVKGGVKATREYIESLKRQIDRLSDENKLKDSYLKKIKEEKGKYPVIEFYEKDEPLLDPVKMVGGETWGVTNLIITFFPEALNRLKEKEEITLFYTIGGENPVEIYKFNDADVLITLGYVGCPSCAGNLEVFYGFGVRNVMFCGGGGVLDKDISVGTLLVVEGAIRDEGFSFQYVAPERVIYTEKEVFDNICKTLTDKKIPYIKGLTWTTDCLFRETKKRIKKRQSEGAKIVEMEQAGCIAIAQFRGIKYGAIIYGGDDVSGDEWDHRGWNTRDGIRYDLVELCKELVCVI